MARKILLADDSVTAQNMGRKILTDAGYEVSTVNNGSAALKKIAELKPDLIVLDVYMPGYSGLEVCQRLKEARETARIPVLLTVGKLEPFKPEEARRARADGFIIKPFEASELLVALTKLEDKIVPQAEPYKPGRFAKAIAAVEQFKNGETGEDFGDSESGWKNRIQFPSASPKTAEPEPEIEIPPAGKKGFRDFFRSERKQKKAEPEFERPLPPGVPADITSEEIAAIAAAAAKVSAPTPPATAAEGKDLNVSPSTAPAEATASETKESVAQEEAPPATFASAAPIAEERPIVSEVPVQETKTEAKAESVAPANVAQTPQTAPAEKTPETKVPEPAVAKAPEPEPSDAEVMAALQSLDRQESKSMEPVTASVPAQSTAAVPAGPRWIAESVAVSPEESALRLEEEMEKAYSAASQATFASTSSGTPAAQHDKPQETAMSAIAQEQVSSAGPASSPAPEAASKSEPAVPAQVEATQPEPAKVEAEPQASSEPVSSEPAKEVQVTEEKIEQDVVAPSTQSDAAAPTPTPEAPMAEAQADAPPVEATAPTGMGESSDSNARTTQEEVSEAAPAAKPSEPDQEVAKTAAAWASWQQVHETVTATQGADEPSAAANLQQDQAQQVQDEAAKAAAQVEKEVLAAAAAAAAGASSDGSAQPANDTAIASIVEGVLAELKPRLVEEIAKKLKK